MGGDRGGAPPVATPALSPPLPSRPPQPGPPPPLHLPVMAGLAQGPGFPNLSCLGLLSDRILRRYVPVKEAEALVPERRERA